MISAINYAAQAEKGLRQWAGAKADYKYRELDVFSAGMMANIIKSAKHFTIPDNGRLFDDKLKGLRGVKARLPYQSITIEYYVEEKDDYSVNTPVYSPKRVVIASELTYETLMALTKFFWDTADHIERIFALLPDDMFLQIFVIAVLDGSWVPMPLSWIMPITWDCSTLNMRRLEPLNESPKDANQFIGLPQATLPGAFNVLVGQIGEQEALRYAVNDISEEMGVVLALCEALACSNVTIDTIQTENKKVNTRRVKKGKLPLYETKVLSIEVPQTHGKTGVTIQERRGPRQHLRRGHIRILKSEKRIWINSCVVGDKKKGRIDKKYRIST